MYNNDNLTGKVIGCAIEVHRNLGPGLLESAYQQCLAHELTLNKIPFTIEQSLPVEYKGIKLDCGYRLDIVIEDKLILEIKSAKKLVPIYEAQLLTYMKLAKINTGLLINFNEIVLKSGIKRLVL
jgi:GxxExxY protein